MEPLELTPDQMRQEAEELASRRAEADRRAAPLLAKQLADDPWPEDDDMDDDGPPENIPTKPR